MTLLYGHRGARGEAPENTLASFQRCLAQGVTRCELDLHLSRDGQLMVIHDPTLRRTTGRRGKVSHYDAAELQHIDARHGGPSWPQPCPIPTLAELFEQCAFEHWQLEVKSASRTGSARLVRAIAALCQQYGLVEHVTLTSSSLTVLKAARELAPELQRGLVAERAWLEPVRVAQRMGCSLLALNWQLCSPQRLQRAQRAGLHVSAWTVNQPLLMQRLAALGVDSLISDFPGLARQVIGSP